MDYAAHTVTVNAADVTVRELYGREHLVAPVVLVKEKVLNGGFLPAEEIERSTFAWNAAPVTANHPMEGDRFIDVRTSPDRMDEYKFGEIFNAEYLSDEKALRGEVWLDIQRALDLGGEAAETLERLASHSAQLRDAVGTDAAAEGESAGNAGAELLEVSTGYWFDPEKKGGSHNGESYRVTQRDIVPDHLAALPNDPGRCSVEDGCGAPRETTSPAAAATANADDGSEERGVVARAISLLQSVAAPPAGTGSNADASANGFSADATADADHESPATETPSDDHQHQHDDCGCGGECGECSESSDTQTAMEINELAEQTDFTVEELSAMDDTHRTKLAAALTSNDEGGEDEPESEPDDEDGEPEDSPSPTDEEEETEGAGGLTREEVAEIAATAAKEALAANETEQKLDQSKATILANTELTEEQLADYSAEQLEAMAEMASNSSVSPPSRHANLGANYAGRGMGSNGTKENDDEGFVMLTPTLAANEKQEEK